MVRVVRKFTFGEHSDWLVEQFRGCSTLVNVADGSPFVTQQGKELIGFIDLVERLRAVDMSDLSERRIVWLLREPDVRTADGRRGLLDVEALRARFVALRAYDSNVLLWLMDRSRVVPLGDGELFGSFVAGSGPAMVVVPAESSIGTEAYALTQHGDVLYAEDCAHVAQPVLAALNSASRFYTTADVLKEW